MREETRGSSQLPVGGAKSSCKESPIRGVRSVLCLDTVQELRTPEEHPFGVIGVTFPSLGTSLHSLTKTIQNGESP